MFALGDTGDCRTDGTRQVASALRAQPDSAQATLIEVGDLSYPTATREQLQRCHEPHFGGFAKRLAVPGNHDWNDPGAAGFFSLFPQPVPRAVDLDSPWRVLLLDSNLEGTAWDKQLEWLDRALGEAGDKCLIAVWHHPRWSSGRHGDSRGMAPLWRRVAGRVSLTLHGHDHHYEALPPLDAEGGVSTVGTRSFVVGNGGTYLYPPYPPKRGAVAVFGQWGFLRLELDGRDYRWQAFNAKGQILDNGAGRCN